MQAFLQIRRAGAALSLAIAASATPNVAAANEIWLSIVEPPWRSAHHWPANDYMALFQSEAPWRDAASHVAVFELSKRFVVESSDADLALVIQDLQRRHIKLSVQATPLIGTHVCGLGAEGHGSPSDMVTIARKLKRLG